MAFDDTSKNLRLKNRIYNKYFVWKAPKNSTDQKKEEFMPYIQLTDNQLLRANKIRKKKRLVMIWSIAFLALLLFLLLVILGS